MSFDIVIMLHIYRAAIYVGVGCKTGLFYLLSVIESQESLPCFVLKAKVAGSGIREGEFSDNFLHKQ